MPNKKHLKPQKEHVQLMACGRAIPTVRDIS